jgi:hypothetical protein
MLFLCAAGLAACALTFKSWFLAACAVCTLGVAIVNHEVNRKIREMEDER